jgi:hypothetical protein
MEKKNYGRYLKEPREATHRVVRNSSIGLSALLSSLFLYYGYSFWTGGRLRVNGTEIRPGVKYDGGTIILCTFCVIIGSFALAVLGQNVKIVVEARVAGKMAY